MRPVVGLSRILTDIFVPLFIWGMMSSLILFVVEVKSLFLPGAEWSSRIGIVGFAAGSVLVARLIYHQGRESATMYTVIFFVLIAIFAMQLTSRYQINVSAYTIFGVNMGIFTLLWWVGQRITESCSIDSEAALKTTGDTGILAHLRIPKREKKIDPEEVEKQWEERLPEKHPGRILLYFALVAVPIFGLGMFLFASTDPAQTRIAVMMFIYLWCTCSLFYLASLGQMRAYFQKREVTLPEQVALPWMGLGATTVAAILLIVFFLPQPESGTGKFVRDRIVSVYQGAQTRSGYAGEISDRSPSSRKTQASEGQKSDPRAAKTKAIPNQQGAAPEAPPPPPLMDAPPDEFSKFMEVLVLALIAPAIVIVVLLTLYIIWLMISANWGRGHAPKIPWFNSKKSVKTPKPARVGNFFSRFSDPFVSDVAPDADLGPIARYLWQATMAWCTDAGSPCPDYQTPAEFLATSPRALKGFEVSSKFMADLFVFSEFSGEPIAPELQPQLQQFWKDLKQHASAHR